MAKMQNLPSCLISYLLVYLGKPTELRLNDSANDLKEIQIMIRKTLIFIGLFLFVLSVNAKTKIKLENPERTLWHDFEGKVWERDLFPIGNGHMGAMTYGGVKSERVQFNVDSLWTGDENPGGGYGGMGSYQNFGYVNVDFNYAKEGEVTDYKRSLNIETAVHNVSFNKNGVAFARESFISKPAQAYIAKYSANKRGQYSGAIRLEDAHGAQITAQGTSLTFRHQLKNGLKYEAQLRIIHQGGAVKVKGDKLVFKGVDSFILVLAADTDYAMIEKDGWRGEDPHERLSKIISDFSASLYKQVRERHIRDYQKFYKRCDLQFGSSDAAVSALSTKERIQRYKKSETKFDADLEEMLFQFGRYLLISSSRPGTLPGNLQGIWNESNNPPWHSDYHTNINIQMNYWLAEPTNLSDCHTPLIDLIEQFAEPCRRATRKEFGPGRGFTFRTSHNIFGGNGWNWNIPASAWYAQHIWEHYNFTRDEKYLRERAYPYLKEITQYWEDHLVKFDADKFVAKWQKQLPKDYSIERLRTLNGKLVVPKGWSPEHGPRFEDGVAHDQQIVWDLFLNFERASKILKVDVEYRKKVTEMRKNLVEPTIGKWGQMMEWIVDRDNPKTGHRHTSQLFAVYPGHQITIEKTPEWAKAAEKSLIHRGSSGDSRRSWTWAWRTALWARFQRAEKSHEMIEGILKHNMLDNLITTHAPLQLDGSYGISAGICEMLLQSQNGLLLFLPALPEVWKDGRIKGIKARGAYTVDMDWKAGKLSLAKIKAGVNGICRIRTDEGFVGVKGKLKNGIFSFPVKAGQTYTLRLR